MSGKNKEQSTINLGIEWGTAGNISWVRANRTFANGTVLSLLVDSTGQTETYTTPDLGDSFPVGINKAGSPEARADIRTMDGYLEAGKHDNARAAVIQPLLENV